MWINVSEDYDFTTRLTNAAGGITEGRLRFRTRRRALGAGRRLAWRTIAVKELPADAK